jgi:hypothetical protein
MMMMMIIMIMIIIIMIIIIIIRQHILESYAIENRLQERRSEFFFQLSAATSIAYALVTNNTS